MTVELALYDKQKSGLKTKLWHLANHNKICKEPIRTRSKTTQPLRSAGKCKIKSQFSLILGHFLPPHSSWREMWRRRMAYRVIRWCHDILRQVQRDGGERLGTRLVTIACLFVFSPEQWSVTCCKFVRELYKAFFRIGNLAKQKLKQAAKWLCNVVNCDKWLWDTYRS